MNRFTLVDGAGNEKPPAMTIDICVIAANPVASRIYYDPGKKYDPSGGDNAPPLCWSDNGTGPSRNAAVPQALTCAACPNAVWGSATSAMTGRGVPACQTGKKIAFLVPSDADDICYLFKIPPASLKNLSQYIKTLSGNKIAGRPVQISDVVTRVEFESQGVVKFSPIALVDEDTFNRTERYYGQPEVLNQITGRDDVARDPHIALPGQAGAAMPPPRVESVANSGLAPAPPAPTSIRQQALQTVKPPPPQAAPPQAASNGKRGRPKKVEDIPPFLPPKQEPVKAVGPGMVEAPEPSNEISKALDNVFNLPGLS